MMKPKIIFFDWYKTLSDSLFWEHLKDEDETKYQLIHNSFLNTYSGLINPWMRGQHTAEDITEKISQDTKINQKYILSELVKSCQNMQLADKDIISVIQELKNKNISVAIATDNMDTFTRWTAPSLKLDQIFDAVLSSWELKALKGDFDEDKSKFFMKYLKNNDIKPEECVLIDDSEDKGNMLESYGINYVQINNISNVKSVARRYLQ